MTIYGCMNGKLKNIDVSDISNNTSHTNFKEKDISIKSLPGYGNLGLKKKDLKPYVENEKSSIKLMNQKVLFDLIDSIFFLIVCIYLYEVLMHDICDYLFLLCMLC